MKKLIIVLALGSWFLALNSCRPQKEIQYIDRVSYIDRLKVDSVYLSKTDSVYIEKRNDTVFVAKYRTLYRDKYHIEKDTVLKRDSVIFKAVEVKTVEVERKLSTLQKIMIAGGELFFWLLLMTAIYFIVKLLIKTKFN